MVFSRLVVLALLLFGLGLMQSRAWAQTSFTATAVAGDGHVEVSWTPLEGAYYVIYVRDSMGYIEKVPGVSSPYTVTGLTNGTTYYFSVTAIFKQDALSTPEVSAMPHQTLPAPTGLSATAGAAQINLSWIAVSGATGYRIIRGTSDSDVVLMTPLNTTSITSYDDSDVIPGRTYHYAVQAFNSTLTSRSSLSISALPLPAAPVLSVTPGTVQSSLFWSAVTGATSYKLYRSTTAGSGSGPPLATVNGTAYSDPSPPNGTTYYYTVKATARYTDSALSNEVAVQPASTLRVPAAPTGLTATPGNDSVYLTWNAASGAATYGIKRSSSVDGPYTEFISAMTATYSFSDVGVGNGAPIYYVVFAENAAGRSADSAPVSATPVAAPFGAPALSATSGNARVTLSWSEIEGAYFYRLYRSTAPGSFFPGSSFGAPLAAGSGTSFINTGLTNGTTYYYVVKAVDYNGGESAASNRVKIMPAPVPSAPAFVTASSGNRQVRLSWQPVSYATSYSLKRGLSASGPFATVATGLLRPSCTDVDLVNGTTYYYVVVAVNSTGTGPGSTPVSATPRALPSPETGPGPDRPLEGVIENMEGAPWAAVRLAAADQADATLGPKYRNVPAATPFYANFQGTFIPASSDTRLAIFSDDGCNVYLDGVLVHNYLNRGQHLPALNQSLIPLDVDLVAGHAYTVRVEYSNTIYRGTTDADGATLFAYTTSENPDRPYVDWLVGQPITSAGIRFPSANLTIQGGAVGNLSAYLATDWDVMQRIENGVISVQDVSDPCSYTWRAGAGTLSATKGAVVVWRAPTVAVPTDVTLTLVVDDQNAANMAPGETGTRNDAARGYNDEPQTFTVTIRVLP